MNALLEISGVVEDQHAIRLAQFVGHVRAKVVPNRIGVPHRVAQQPLHRMRGAIPGLFRQLPARPTVHIG
jgi:hypothetical protein